MDHKTTPHNGTARGPEMSDDISVKIKLPVHHGEPGGRPVDLIAPPVAKHGQCKVHPDGTMTYHPEPGFVGTDTISYGFTDRQGCLNSTHCAVTVDAVACFTPGTRIATPKGERRVENLRVGDQVITRDNGIQDIRWTGAKQVGWKMLAGNEHLRPILIQAGALGNGLPEHDMLVSPNHRVLVSNDRTALFFEDREILVSAKHLINNNGVHSVEAMGATYHHFMFDDHQVVLSNGCWTESFQPGDYSLKAVGNAQRTEIIELFPDLKTDEGLQAYGAARQTLSREQAELLYK